jgi:hypothetical protein
MVPTSKSKSSSNEIERNRAIDISHQVHSGAFTVQEASKILANTLTNYSQETESASLDFFVKNICNIEEFTIHPVTNEIGWSGNSAYYVRDIKSGDVKFLIKKFNTNLDELFAEIFGIQYLQNVHGISSPQLCAIGKHFQQNLSDFFILETPASGHSFQFYFNEVGKFPIETIEHQRAFETLVEGCRNAGSALAKLHSHEGIKLIPFPKQSSIYISAAPIPKNIFFQSLSLSKKLIKSYLPST